MRVSSADPLITIAIPFHSGLEYLRLAVESALAQDDGRFELLVCDEGAEGDAPARLLAGFADDRIRHHRNRAPLGMSRNWNQCIDLARADRVTLLHQDDMLMPGYVSLVLGLARAHPEATACFCMARIIDEKGEPTFSLPDRVKDFFVPHGEGDLVLRGQEAVCRLLAGNFIIIPTLCFERRLLGSHRFSEEWSQVQDLELTTRLLEEGHVLAGSRQRAYAYRRHEASATTQQSESMLRFEEEFRLYDRLAQRYAGCGWRRAARVAARKRMLKLHLGYRILRAALSGRPTRAAYLLGWLYREGPPSPSRS